MRRSTLALAVAVALLALSASPRRDAAMTRGVSVALLSLGLLWISQRVP